MNTWEIYTYGAGDQLREIFNFIANVFGGNDYVVALKTSALVGFIGVLISAAFERAKLNIQWLLGMIMIYMTLIVPKTNIAVVDRLAPVNTAVVSNVPIGVGILASIMSQLGDWATRKFEANLSMPNQPLYSGSGFLFYQRLVEESTRFEVTTPTLSASLADFWKSCVYYDLLLGLYTWDQVVESKDLEDFFGTKTSQTRSFTYQGADGSKSILTCRTGFNDQLKKGMDQEREKAKSIHGKRIMGAQVTNAQIVDRFKNTLPIAYQYLTGLSMEYSKILSQNILANSLKRGLTNFASDADAAAAAQDFALARAEAERKTTFAVMSNVAKKYLPILKNIFEGLIYSLSPIVLILAMMPVAARVLGYYAKAVFWVNIWAPMYAVLNFYMARSAAAEGAAAVSGSAFQTGLSVMTNTGLGQAMNEQGVIAGYLTLSIPLVAWLMVQFSGAVMAGIAGRIMQGYEGPVAGSADEAVTGNIGLGNTSFNNHRAFQVQTAPNIDSGAGSSRGVDGVTSTFTPNGIYSRLPTSDGGLAINFTSSLSSIARSSLMDAKSRESAASFDVIKANADVSALMNQISQRTSQSETTSNQVSASSRSSYTEAQAQTDRLVDSWANRNGMSFQGARELASRVEASAGAGVGDFASFKAGYSGTISKGMLTEERYESMRQFLSSQEYTSARQAEVMALRSSQAGKESGISDAEDRSLKIATERQDSTQERASEARRDVRTASKTLENAEQYSAEIQAKGLDGFINWMSRNTSYSRDDVVNYLAAYNRGDREAQGIINRNLVEYQRGFMQDKTHDVAGPMRELPQGRSAQGAEALGQPSDRYRETKDSIGTTRGKLEEFNNLMLPIDSDKVKQEGDKVKGEVETEFSKGLLTRMNPFSD